MCYFLAISLKNRTVTDLQQAFGRGLDVARTRNPSIQATLPKGYDAYLLISGGCSCDLFRPSSKKPDGSDHLKSLERKYKKKGWPQSKIRRALQQSEENRKGIAGTTGLSGEILPVLQELLNEEEDIYIVAHWFNEDIESEKLDIAVGPTVAGEELSLGNCIEETDKLYRLTGRC